MEKHPSQDLRGLIRELRLEARRLGARPRAHFAELAQRRIDAPQDVLDWATRDRRWSFTLAELMAGPAARPHELAVRLLIAIVDELEEEREVLDADATETSASRAGEPGIVARE